MKGAQRRQPAGSGCSQQHVPLSGLKSPPGMIYSRCSSCCGSPEMAPAPAARSRNWWSGSPHAMLRSPQRWEGAAGVTQMAHEVSVWVSCLYVVRNWMVLFLPPLCRRQNKSSVSFEPQYPQYHCPASRRSRCVLRGDRSPSPALPEVLPAPAGHSSLRHRRHLSSPQCHPPSHRYGAVYYLCHSQAPFGPCAFLLPSLGATHEPSVSPGELFAPTPYFSVRLRVFLAVVRKQSCGSCSFFRPLWFFSLLLTYFFVPKRAAAFLVSFVQPPFLCERRYFILVAEPLEGCSRYPDEAATLTYIRCQDFSVLAILLLMLPNILFPAARSLEAFAKYPWRCLIPERGLELRSGESRWL